MHKVIGSVLLVAGLFLLIRGHDISQSINSQVKNLFTGTPVKHVIYYYVGGAACLAVGLAEIFRKSEK